MSADDTEERAATTALLRAATAVDRQQLTDAMDEIGALGPFWELHHRDQELLPQVFARGRDLGVEHDTSPDLARAYKRTWATNQMVVFKIRPILDFVSEQGGRAIVLKGAAMVSSAYLDDVGCRAFHDIDVLLEPSTVSATVDFALEQGWTPEGPKSVEEYLAVHHAIDLRHGDSGAIDLHWELLAFDRSPERTAELFDHTVEATLGGRTVRILEPTQLLFHTLAHAKPEGHRHVVDAVTILERHAPTIDWDAVQAEAMARRELAATERSLRQVVALRPELVPGAVLDELHDAHRHWSDYVFAGEKVGSRPSGVKRFAADWSGRSRGATLRERIRIARILAGSYGNSSGVGLRRKAVRFLVSGPTGGERERSA